MAQDNMLGVLTLLRHSLPDPDLAHLLFFFVFWLLEKLEWSFRL